MSHKRLINLLKMKKSKINSMQKSCCGYQRLLVSICLILGMSCTALATLHWQQPEYLMQSFLEVALKNEFDTRKSHLRKWEDAIRVHMVYEYPNAEQYQHLVNKHLLHLSQITQHPIYLARDPASANLTIRLTTEKKWEEQYLTQYDERMQQQLQTIVCMGKMRFGSMNAIVGGTVIIPVDRAIRHRKLVTCIVEELTQVMGLPNDSESVFPSIFNDKTPNDLLTGLDYVLLKLLYQPALKNNMDENQIRAVGLPILKQWESDGLLATSAQTVRQGKLYRLLGFE